MAVNVAMVRDLLRVSLDVALRAYRERHSPVEADIVVVDEGLLFIADHCNIGRIEALLPSADLQGFTNGGNKIAAFDLAAAGYRRCVAVILPEYIFPDEAVIGYDM